jgi:hypothetical protein
VTTRLPSHAHTRDVAVYERSTKLAVNKATDLAGQGRPLLRRQCAMVRVSANQADERSRVIPMVPAEAAFLDVPECPAVDHFRHQPRHVVLIRWLKRRPELRGMASEDVGGPLIVANVALTAHMIIAQEGERACWPEGAGCEPVARRGIHPMERGCRNDQIEGAHRDRGVPRSGNG